MRHLSPHLLDRATRLSPSQLPDSEVAAKARLDWECLQQPWSAGRASQVGLLDPVDPCEEQA